VALNAIAAADPPAGRLGIAHQTSPLLD
jgi:hypothetical protein